MFINATLSKVVWKGQPMVSNVTILGQASDPIKDQEGFRSVIVESCEAFNEQSFFSKIPVRHWDRGTSKVLLDIPNGDIVCIFGRIESDPNIGLYILAEQIRHFKSNLSQKKE